MSGSINKTRKITYFPTFLFILKRINLPIVSLSVPADLISMQTNWQPSEQHLNFSSQSASSKHSFDSSSGGGHFLSSSIGGHSPKTRHACV